MEKKINENTKEIIKFLKKNNQTITFAESCTGGRIASAFTAISGASSVFNGSIVSYSNEIKSKWLKVNKKTLLKYGAVSSQCVDEMLDGACKMAKANYVIAISGIAGPTGGNKLKPVGTVYIGIKTPSKKVVKKYLFKGDRESIQNQATTTAIEFLKKNI
jgi:nicotinamide-nucleotide amidase